MSWPRTRGLPYRVDAAAFFEAVRDLDWPIWLDSGRPASRSGRYDIISAAPVKRLRVPSAALCDVEAQLRAPLRGYPPWRSPLPFTGGLIGFLSYELGRLWSGMRAHTQDRLADDLCAGIYDWALVIDHRRCSATLVGRGTTTESRELWALLCERLSTLPASPQPQAQAGRKVSLGRSGADYGEGFRHIQHYIREGDVYQVNYTRRLLAETSEDAWSLYRRLRALSPAPYGAFLDFGDYQVLSNSPEQFVSLEGDRVQTRPIKGTRPRGNTPLADASLREALHASDKDRAENLMIVDLLRNDLGRVCRPGSIEVPELFAVESFAKVHHLVSTVTGRLAAGRDAVDLLRACFPGGSITGAPKRRAMQIIDELEPVSRELYCGSVFRLGFDGRLDSNIAIRTVLKRDRQLCYWTGGGIVADSRVDGEYRESEDKARAFLELLGHGNHGERQ